MHARGRSAVSELQLVYKLPHSQREKAFVDPFFLSIREEQKVHFVGDFKVFFSLVINLHTRSH